MIIYILLQLIIHYKFYKIIKLFRRNTVTIQLFYHYNDSEIYFRFDKYLYINYNINVKYSRERIFLCKIILIVKLVYFKETIIILL